MEAATARQVDGGGELAQNRRLLVVHLVLLHGGGGGKKHLGVGVRRRGVQGVGGGSLHHGAQVHHSHAVGDVAHHAQVVANEQNRQAELLLQVAKQVDDLRLDGDVECRNRLVGDDELGLHGQGAGDADALALAAREGARQAVGLVLAEAHELEQLDDACVDLGLGAHVVVQQLLAQHLAHGHAGVERGVGILEDHLDVFAAVAQLMLGKLGEVNARKDDLAARGVVQVDDRAGKRGLAATRLAHQAERLACVEGERHVVHGGEVLALLAHDGVKHAVLEREALAQVGHLKQGLALCGGLGSLRLFGHYATPPFFLGVMSGVRASAASLSALTPCSEPEAMSSSAKSRS